MINRQLHRVEQQKPGMFGFVAIFMSVIMIAGAPLHTFSQEEKRVASQSNERSLVARLSLVAGEVSYQRAGDSAQDWYDATINLPLEETDQLYTGNNGRAEIQLDQGNLIRLDRETNLRVTAYRPRLIQLALPVGTVAFRLRSLDPVEVSESNADNQPGSGDSPRPPAVAPGDDAADGLIHFEIDTPGTAVILKEPGSYRVNVLPDGTTELLVIRGQAEVFQTEMGTLTIREGRRFRIEGSGTGLFEVTRIDEFDDWDRWNDRRDEELEQASSRRSERYVPTGIPGNGDLDRYGDWLETPEYGWVWSPRGVGDSWAPYRLGYWRWYGTYGWTWISHEPWGWVPYHYGRWAWHRQRWFWVPASRLLVVGYRGPVWRWSPHLVIFFGWGDNRYFNGYRDGRRWLGWCPLAPGENRDGWGGDRGRNLRNYQAPGGVSGIESRRFAENRVVAVGNSLTVPSRQGRSIDEGGARFVNERELRPVAPVRPQRTSLIEREDVRRRLNSESPLVVRRRMEPVAPPPVAGDATRSPFRPSPKVIPQPLGRPGTSTTIPPVPGRSLPSGRPPVPSRYPPSSVPAVPEARPSRPAVVPSRPAGGMPRVESPRRMPGPATPEIPRRESRPGPPSAPAREASPPPAARPARQASPPPAARPAGPARRPPP